MHFIYYKNNTDNINLNKSKPRKTYSLINISESNIYKILNIAEILTIVGFISWVIWASIK